VLKVNAASSDSTLNPNKTADTAAREDNPTIIVRCTGWFHFENGLVSAFAACIIASLHTLTITTAVAGPTPPYRRETF
jgi:hypothetical protein